jgi:DNA polymerase III alpha subunit (gram-positive type)
MKKALWILASTVLVALLAVGCAKEQDLSSLKEKVEDLSSRVAKLEEAVKKGPFVSREDVRDRAKISNTIIDKMGELGILGNLPQSNQFSLFDFMNA